MSKVFD
jgi:hypothetical protein